VFRGIDQLEWPRWLELRQKIHLWITKKYIVRSSQKYIIDITNKIHRVCQVKTTVRDNAIGPQGKIRMLNDDNDVHRIHYPIQTPTLRWNLVWYDSNSSDSEKDFGVQMDKNTITY
jgi:hypothetical protein